MRAIRFGLGCHDRGASNPALAASSGATSIAPRARLSTVCTPHRPARRPKASPSRRCERKKAASPAADMTSRLVSVGERRRPPACSSSAGPSPSRRSRRSRTRILGLCSCSRRRGRWAWPTRLLSARTAATPHRSLWTGGEGEGDGRRNCDTARAGGVGAACGLPATPHVPAWQGARARTTEGRPAASAASSRSFISMRVHKEGHFASHRHRTSGSRGRDLAGAIVASEIRHPITQLAPSRPARG